MRNRGGRWGGLVRCLVGAVAAAQEIEIVPREYRPTLQVLLASNNDDGCVDTCIRYNLDGTSVIYTDDGQGPVVSGTTASQTVPANTSTFTITGTLTDQVPIDEVLINGLPCSSYLACTLTPVSGGGIFTTTFSVTVPVVEGTNSFAITGVGLCKNTTLTAAQVVITVPPDLCGDPSFDMCMDGQTGSVFYVDVVRDQDAAVCQLRCEIAAPGAALTASPSNAPRRGGVSSHGAPAAEAAGDQHVHQGRCDDETGPADQHHVQHDAAADDGPRHPVRGVVPGLVERHIAPAAGDRVPAEHRAAQREAGADEVREEPRADLRITLGLGDTLRFVDHECADEHQHQREQHLAAFAEDAVRGGKQYLWSRVNVPEYKRRCTR